MPWLEVDGDRFDRDQRRHVPRPSPYRIRFQSVAGHHWLSVDNPPAPLVMLDAPRAGGLSMSETLTQRLTILSLAGSWDDAR